MTRVACSCSSSLVACSSRVLRSENLEDRDHHECVCVRVSLEKKDNDDDDNVDQQTDLTKTDRISGVCWNILKHEDTCFQGTCV